MTLIERLRKAATVQGYPSDDLAEAADAIEKLQAENERLKADAERWRKFASLDYKMRCQWVTNLSLMPVLREDIDKFILDADGSINADAEPTKSQKTWCDYVAGVIGTYLNEPDESDKCKAIAGIIERRLWALPTPPEAK